ncbi:uncharacterized protein wu:fb55g09 [Chanos chanos]|uniref:Uncharacterized protein wu:fb55g09 n=1 Tax=Chanos chanos TaxID=29144 RepID=A0A6J2VR37_CHACN|nr:uncharacterized protein LOC115815630 [Chanos chanos]
MLFEETMCGKGMMCQWKVYSDRPAIKDKVKDEPRKGSSKHSWYKCGRRQGKRGRVNGHHLTIRQQNQTRQRLSGAASLRPVNIQGIRAPGMRAPKNTNQFLMHEKYQMMHMRSDSIGTDSGSDCEMDFADMDSYLGVLENARGALLDSPDLGPRQMGDCQTFTFFSFGEIDQEESMQYFPSEDDVMQSEDFMQKDFNEFCDTVAPVAPCL